MTMTMMHNPASPGELLREFLGNTTATQLAEHIGVARATISRIINDRTAVTMDLSIRLGKLSGFLPTFSPRRSFSTTCGSNHRKSGGRSGLSQPEDCASIRA